MPVRPSAARLAALFLALLLLVGLSTASAFAALPAQTATGVSVVATGADRLASLVPGDELPGTTLEVRAQGSVRYVLAVKTSGSALLPGLLIVTVRAATGDVLYEGPLADVHLGDGSEGFSGGRVLRNATEVLSISSHLSTDAGNEVQGAQLSVTWIVQATELTPE